MPDIPNAFTIADCAEKVDGMMELARQETLLKTGALQKAIFNSANFSSIATDAKGVIQIFNVGAERMLGYAAQDVMNKITPADISDPQEVIARAMSLSAELGTSIMPGFEALVFKASRGIEDIYELTYIRKDGSRLPAVVSVTALRDDQDAIIGYLLIGTDNTARKMVETERALLARALQEKNAELENAKLAAEKANLAKSDFLSSMSHELRTPLSAILGFAQLIESGTPKPTPAQARGVQQILQAGWYLLELINEILDLALIESGKLSLSLESVLLSDVMRECEAMVGSQAQKRGITVVFPPADLPYTVSADRIRVKQVLINLLTNGIKYNRVYGSVSVHCIEQPPGRIRICVGSPSIRRAARRAHRRRRRYLWARAVSMAGFRRWASIPPRSKPSSRRNSARLHRAKSPHKKLGWKAQWTSASSVWAKWGSRWRGA